MPNKVVIFPESKLASAQGYVATCDAHYAATFEPGQGFGYVHLDAFGQHVTPYYGPPWFYVEGVPFEEPAECLAARADGVLHDSAVWPDVEE